MSKLEEWQPLTADNMPPAEVPKGYRLEVVGPSAAAYESPLFGHDDEGNWWAGGLVYEPAQLVQVYDRWRLRKLAE